MCQIKLINLIKFKRRLERWLSSEDCALVSQRTELKFLTPMSGGSAFCNSSSKGSDMSHLHEHLHACVHTHMQHTHAEFKIIKNFKFKRGSQENSVSVGDSR